MLMAEATPIRRVRRAAGTSLREALIVLDFDGILVNSYRLLHDALGHLGLDVGDEERFRHRRKFLKYLGGGRELVRNFVSLSLPKKKKIRARLTDEYVAHGRLYPEFVPLLNRMIAHGALHVGVVSRNFTHAPGLTIRAVLRNSGVDEQHLDFVVPVPVGAKKVDVLEAMRSPRYRQSLLCADEVGDYRAAVETGYDALMASYGFDSRTRLMEQGEVPEDQIFDTPGELAAQLHRRLGVYLK